MRVRILGSAAGGGFPQWNCRCPTCEAARAGAAARPRTQSSIAVRDQPGWISFSIDGRRAYPSTGEVFDVKTKKRVAVLTDETGRAVGSEKLLEIVFEGQRVARVGNQFGVGVK